MAMLALRLPERARFRSGHSVVNWPDLPEHQAEAQLPASIDFVPHSFQALPVVTPVFSLCFPAASRQNLASVPLQAEQALISHSE